MLRKREIPDKAEQPQQADLDIINQAQLRHQQRLDEKVRAIKGRLAPVRDSVLSILADIEGLASDHAQFLLRLASIDWHELRLGGASYVKLDTARRTVEAYLAAFNSIAEARKLLGDIVALGGAEVPAKASSIEFRAKCLVSMPGRIRELLPVVKYHLGELAQSLSRQGKVIPFPSNDPPETA